MVHSMWLGQVNRTALRYLNATCTLQAEGEPVQGEFGGSTPGEPVTIAENVPCVLIAASRTARSQVFTIGLQESFNEQAIFVIPATYNHEYVRRILFEGLAYRAVGPMPHMSGFPFRMIIVELE
jgi:hypothetical protein